MKKYIVKIEETVDDDFEVMANSPEEALSIAEEKYWSCDFIVGPNVTHRQMIVTKDNEELTDWVEFGSL